MGIPGLWAELAPAAQTTTLPSYCLTAFARNANELRGIRLGIDASLWLFHAQQSSGGANPYLRLLFYRLAKLLSLPVLPLFVFDGPSRPNWKRGKQVKGRQHAIEQPFTQLIEAFGYQWHRAQGEAEAELAYLNQTGHVDAVLTDDSDALLFGAQVLIRNWGRNLSGTRALNRTASASSDVFDDATPSGSKSQLSGSDRDHLITLYQAEHLVTAPDLGIDRDGLILVALMSGGDYDTTGLMQCGVKIALALARGGYGTKLITAFKESYPDQDSASRTSTAFQTFMKGWLEDVREELRTNGKGFLPSRRPKLASSIEESFLSTQESRKVLAWYVYPLTSESENKVTAVVPGKSCTPDLTRLARLSQIYFHWSREAILSKFRTILGPGVVARRLRQEALEHNDGAGEGPWAALVESPASKAVRRHMLGLDEDDAQSGLNRDKASALNKRKPLHDGPNATRITDFFSKTPTTARSPAGTSARNDTTDMAQASVEILAVRLERRHAALAPFLDYRVLVSMAEFGRTADKGIDAQLDAELATSRAQNEDSETDIDELEEARATRPAPKRTNPEDPLLMWIPEPLLTHSTSGNAPLREFRAEAERKANTARNKLHRKTLSTNLSENGCSQQKSLMDFARPLAKPWLTSVTKSKLVTPSSTPSPLQSDQASEASQTGRQARQLVVPKGMQRRTESMPVSTSLATAALGRTRGLSRHTSLPAPAELETEELDGDSSIEFLGSFVSTARQADTHTCSSIPTSPFEKGTGEARPIKSPKKTVSVNVKANALFNRSSFSAAGAKTKRAPSADEVVNVDALPPRFGTTLTSKNRARISAITISDDSSSE